MDFSDLRARIQGILSAMNDVWGLANTALRTPADNSDGTPEANGAADCPDRSNSSSSDSLDNQSSDDPSEESTPPSGPSETDGIAPTNNSVDTVTEQLTGNSDSRSETDGAIDARETFDYFLEQRPTPSIGSPEADGTTIDATDPVDVSIEPSTSSSPETNGIAHATQFADAAASPRVEVDNNAGLAARPALFARDLMASEEWDETTRLREQQWHYRYIIVYERPNRLDPPTLRRYWWYRRPHYWMERGAHAQNVWLAFERRGLVPPAIRETMVEQRLPDPWVQGDIHEFEDPYDSDEEEYEVEAAELDELEGNSRRPETFWEVRDYYFYTIIYTP
ncbi:hypothetical protein F4678DRAFT_460398 [Xylaria arbuscula]|nr:hypothetical protein F4678DRAFT_460398 [Xylaria arbuscula]